MSRKIPLGRQSLTGYLPLRPGITGRSGIGGTDLAYESRLERDALVLLQFDHQLAVLVTQPFTIAYQHEGKAARYTPDIGATWIVEGCSPYGYRTMIFEVKPKDRLERDRKLLEPRFAAARAYADERKWGFAILTETEIRTPRLKNAELLTPHWLSRPDEKLSTAIIEIVSQAGCTTIGEVEQRAVRAGWPLVVAASAIKNLIASRELLVDLDQPLTERTTLRYWGDEIPFHDDETENPDWNGHNVQRQAGANRGHPVV